jgi:5-methylcytosine-specific restriction protein A
VSPTYISPALRHLVYERAGGCYAYCLISAMAVFATHEIDHIIAQKHGGPTVADNLALSCSPLSSPSGLLV